MKPEVQASITRLNRMAHTPLPQFVDLINVELCNLTQSTLSYFATVNPTQTELTMIGWSKSAMMNCALTDKPIVYKIVDTGLWGDAVREGKPVYTNDYPGLVKPTKKGYPQGHVNVRRHMNLPIRDGGKIVMIIGVGNKRDPYNAEDAQLIQDLMTEVWKTLKLKV